MWSALGSCLSERERTRQAEPWQHAVVEAGEGADLVAGEGEDDEAGPVADAGVGAKVGPERRLTIGSRRHEVDLRPEPKMLAKRRVAAARPWY
jgi:hypothetical protein